MQHSTGNFLDIADAAPIGVLAISRDGSIRFANGALLRIFGYAEAALLGQQVEMLLPPELQGGHAGLRTMFFAAPAARGMGEGRKLFGRRADGSQVAVEIGLGSTGSGDTLRAIAFINDVSQRTQSEERFAAMIAALPVGLVMIDAEGRIEVTNQVLDTMFGYEPGTLLGEKIEILLPPRNRAGHPALREGYARAPRLRTMGPELDLMGRHRSGTEFAVEIALAPLQYENHAASLALITDISIGKKLVRALQQANANLEEFAYITSHDLRSPLRGIADLLDWIEDDLASGQDIETIINNISRAKQRIVKAERMIEDLLTYAQAGAESTRKETVNLRALLQDVVEDANVPAGFTVTIDAENTSFVTQRIPLQTALRNLLDNALKHHGGTSGRIKCSVREAGRFYVLTVDDDGAGVPDTARVKIFKLFNRSRSPVEGHGIGLSVARRMVASHGGELVLDEVSALGGASFAIYWPQVESRVDE